MKIKQKRNQRFLNYTFTLWTVVQWTKYGIDAHESKKSLEKKDQASIWNSTLDTHIPTSPFIRYIISNWLKKWIVDTKVFIPV